MGKIPPFRPTPTPGTYKGQPCIEVNCRRWKTIMRRLRQPQRRRFALGQENEASEYCADLIVQHATGRRSAREAVVVRQLFSAFLETVKAEKADDTYRSYRNSLRRFERYLDDYGVKSTADVSPALLKRYRAYLFTEIAPGSVVRYMAILHAAFEWASGDYLEFNPVAGLVPRAPDQRRRALTDDERDQIIADCDSRARPLWLFMLSTGLRTVEVVRMEPRDAVFDGSPTPFVRVHGKGGKERTVPMLEGVPELAEGLLAIAPGGNLVLPWGRHRIWELWKADRGKLKLSEEITPHCFRHDFATFLCNETEMPLTEVRDVMGHSSIKITERYLHPDRAQLRSGLALRARQIGIPRVSEKDSEDATPANPAG